MYDLAVGQLARTLRNLDAVMAKAQEYAKTRKFDVNNFCTARLAPDMLPFSAQVRIACDHAKFVAAVLARKEAPKHEDTEVTFEDLRGRIAKCLAYLDSFTAADFAATKGDAVIGLPNRAGKGMLTNEYLWQRQIPNFYFHVVTAYDLLRHGGVDIGKTDFLGPLNIVET